MQNFSDFGRKSKKLWRIFQAGRLVSGIGDFDGVVWGVDLLYGLGAVASKERDFQVAIAGILFLDPAREPFSTRVESVAFGDRTAAEHRILFPDVAEAGEPDARISLHPEYDIRLRAG